ncbi:MULTISPECIES: phenylalanine--tRNA ligase subunit alpha [Leptospira]|uniref:Phenylalanine--tRNA ligase alpha subunit n=1 Tax=Leptospira kirschneri str. 200802841 TaxID=1193047 RepID=A0A828Y9N5_9LEPT|nr:MULTISPECIES: phenylalanine--tRNA ligase subunit alpha [Leptospira]EKO52137.1 phenylalanine--tRNA ligase, alpha subunit [Leptospira kirschneri str. 200802841]EKP04280.1 phenylalanine--tRNA ligase, alpha subunit [Leptospira kirschneri str. 2008720114]EMK08245.1 phenylalanine--tRNA ligase, alpha subunit [Leptospira kirschneri]EMK17407.1 phenylalanine--tRNA ligase, alpha subunit [Leptospira kirschneri serovar Bim str. PUO 1247]EMN06144.1 phenylalanine--tRNA ligase, alpha subunit [Leptospira ki
MNLSEELDSIYKEAIQKIGSSISEEDLDKNKNDFIGKKGKLTAVLKNVVSLSIEEKKTVGQKANELSKKLETFVSETKTSLKKKLFEKQAASEFFDVLRPLPKSSNGSLHPITQIQYEIEDIFASMGFSIMDGPEIETDTNNFGALNFTEDHPAREMQDTFYLENGNLLRTHTSAIQVRTLRKLKPPFRIIAPGRVFRYEEVDASHEHTFYQIEGMVVGKDISAANLIDTMQVLLSRIFEKEIKTRLRPGYFPFVEPGFELDINCLVCDGKGCPVCKQSGWLELLPCGLIHPNVLSHAGLDPKEWTGFAFGLGLDRLVMMRYGIHDIRYFQSGNLRFLKQF